MRATTPTGLLACALLAAGVAAADPRGGASLAAPGACAQPDPDLETPVVQAMPPSVAGRPGGAFSPDEIDPGLLDLIEKTTSGLTSTRSTTGEPTLLGGVLSAVGLGGGTSGGGGALPAVDAEPILEIAGDPIAPAEPLLPAEPLGDPLQTTTGPVFDSVDELTKGLLGGE